MTTIVKLTGTLTIIDYCSKELINDEETFFDQYYTTGAWDKIESLTVNDNEENLVKQKGKYCIKEDALHEIIEDGHPLPVECHTRQYYDQELVYEIEHEGEFDIKKLQLVKSTYEFDEIPFWIVADYILYDGERFDNDEITDYDVESKCYNTFELE